jgi:hypothetical protein
MKLFGCKKVQVSLPASRDRLRPVTVRQRRDIGVGDLERMVERIATEQQPPPRALDQDARMPRRVAGQRQELQGVHQASTDVEQTRGLHGPERIADVRRRPVALYGRPLVRGDDVPGAREPRLLRFRRHQPTDVVLVQMREHEDVDGIRRDIERGEVRVQRARHTQPAGGRRSGRADTGVDEHACAGGADQHDVRPEPPATFGADRRRKSVPDCIPAGRGCAGERVCQRARVIGDRVTEHIDHHAAKVYARHVAHVIPSPVAPRPGRGPFPSAGRAAAAFTGIRARA